MIHSSDMETGDISPDMVDVARKFSLLKLFPKTQRLKPTGIGKYMTNCPFHDDAKPSMSVRKGDDGKWRYHCFGCNERGDVVDYVQADKSMSFTDSVIMLYNRATSAPPKPVEIAHYDYVDETGVLLYQVVRYEPKGFRQRLPLDNDRWCWSLGNVRRVLYRLPHLAACKPGSVAYFCEGEKDVQSLERHGLVATTHAGGAGGWRPEYAMSLWGLNVVIVPDRDEPGYKMAEQVRKGLAATAASVFMCEPPHGKDVTEYLETGGDIVTLLSQTKRV